MARTSFFDDFTRQCQRERGETVRDVGDQGVDERAPEPVHLLRVRPPFLSTLPRRENPLTFGFLVISHFLLSTSLSRLPPLRAEGKSSAKKVSPVSKRAVTARLKSTT